MADRRDCDAEQLGLEESERASLTGFTRRVAQGLAHLREAWSVADESNVRALERAFKAVFTARSVKESRGLFERVLTAGFDDEPTRELLRKLKSTGRTADAEIDALREQIDGLRGQLEEAKATRYLECPSCGAEVESRHEAIS